MIQTYHGYFEDEIIFIICFNLVIFWQKKHKINSQNHYKLKVKLSNHPSHFYKYKYHICTIRFTSKNFLIKYQEVSIWCWVKTLNQDDKIWYDSEKPTKEVSHYFPKFWYLQEESFNWFRTQKSLSLTVLLTKISFKIKCSS